MKTTEVTEHNNLARKKKEEDKLDLLVTFDRLEIGPVKIEEDRLKAPYRIFQRNKKIEEIEFIYKYEEAVFEPNEEESLNLANVLAAQVALNYGLFCHEIVFRGKFDVVDQKFLQVMAENTAREIYVKKFLQYNPYIIGKAAKLPVIRKKNYLKARIIFPDGHFTSSAPRAWESDKKCHVILSSGGKDSLLSYGLLNEIGQEVHPIFINESGRHWFTALNAYRYFKEHIPHTSKVWVNSDRVFSWMTRLFPFVRKDFARIRHDEYPIRLWTVAIFLFAAIPLMRKRKIGRLIIGDEHDTSYRTSFKGITHYNGLYDQSIYFDNALTRYFSRKKWNITQFSILRPLSEMLIEKILTERYPHLQAQQMSCHMTHTEGNRVKPCGRCEKCRRIVSMLMAIDADPAPCGYSPKKVDEMKKNIGLNWLHQESNSVSHLFYMLSRKKQVSFPKEMEKKIKPHPEILKVRIDPEKSPIYSIPSDLREQLFQIYLSHAEGSVMRNGREWKNFNLLQHSE